MKFTLLNRPYRLSWIGLSVYLILMTLLCSLGFWQLSRAEQKKQILLQQQTAIDAKAINLNQHFNLDVDAVRYRKVELTGRYDVAHQFLLENQIVDGKNGYFVLTPCFVDDQSNVVLINRGWIPSGKDRNDLPNVFFKAEPTPISGRLNRFPSVGIKLKGAEIPSDSWPSVVQVVDTKVLSERLGYTVMPYQIELDAEAPQGYIRKWQINVPIPPEKHLAYAVQWFALALTLTVLFIWMTIRNRSEHSA
ncbi:SURF1 family protein [Methylomonas sp. MgM2]